MMMFSSKGRNLARIVKFIDRVRLRGGSVLIHSAHGTGRAVYAVMAYFMAKFQWSVGKALEFVDSKRPGVCPKPMFLRQLARAAGDQASEGDSFQSRWLNSTDSSEINIVFKIYFIFILKFIFFN